LVLLAASLSFAASAAGVRPVIYDKSEIAFTVTQMGVGVSGGFRRFSATVILDPAKLETSSAEVEVDIGSITTGEPEADAEAVKKPWLDAVGFPKATFKSSSVRALGGERYEAKGTLSIKGKARELTVPFTLKNQPDGTSVVSGQFGIRRTDFGVGGGEWNEGELVANEVPVRFRLTLGAAR
jgi:polyisoprenoid-binding protein YceI